MLVQTQPSEWDRVYAQLGGLDVVSIYNLPTQCLELPTGFGSDTSYAHAVQDIYESCVCGQRQHFEEGTL